MSIPESMFDVRVVERHLQEGRITQADYDAFLAGLDDCADNLEMSHASLVTHHRPRIVQSDVREEEEG